MSGARPQAQKRKPLPGVSRAHAPPRTCTPTTKPPATSCPSRMGPKKPPASQVSTLVIRLLGSHDTLRRELLAVIRRLFDLPG